MYRFELLYLYCTNRQIMENRICILTLFVFLFLLSGESRAMVAMPDAWTRMMIGVNQKDWSLLRERVQTDLHVPDREDVLMLIDYHRDGRMKCENLLRRLNGGEAYRYIMNKILPLLYVYREHSPVPIPDDKAAGVFLSTANVLPRVKFVHPQPVVPEEGKIETPVIIEQRTVLALKNNLLYDLALAPNIEVEIPLNRRWSVNAEYKCPWWLNSSREFCFREALKVVAGWATGSGGTAWRDISLELMPKGEFMISSLKETAIKEDIMQLQG